MLTPIVIAVVGQIAAGTAGAFDSSRAAVTPVTTVMEIDTGKLKGSPLRLAWADDGALFLRTAEVDRLGNERGRNYVIKVGTTELVAVEDPPAWASLYWAWKSGFAAPGVPTLRFDVETRTQSRTAVGSSAEAPGATGFVNPNNSDPSQSQIAKDVASMQRVSTTTVKLKGQLIVESQNQSVAPGVMFGWAPSPMGALAYSDSRRRLVLLDREGHKLEVPGTADVLLPAWSPDGKRIAFLRKKDRKKYSLNLVTIESK